VFCHSPFWSLQLLLPRVLWLPSVYSSPALLHSQVLSYAMPNSEFWEIQGCISYGLSIPLHSLSLLQCIFPPLNTSSQAPILKISISGNSCYNNESITVFVWLLRIAKSWTMPTTLWQLRGSVSRQLWNSCFLCWKSVGTLISMTVDSAVCCV